MLAGAGLFFFGVGFAAVVALVINTAAVRHVQAAGDAGFENGVRAFIISNVVMVFIGIEAVAFEAQRYRVWATRDPGPLGRRVLHIVDMRGGQASLQEVLSDLYAEDHRRDTEHEALSFVLGVTCGRLPWLGLLENATPGGSLTESPYRITDAGIIALRKSV